MIEPLALEIEQGWSAIPRRRRVMWNLLVAAGLLAFSAAVLLLTGFPPAWRWAHLPLYSALHVIGAAAAVSLALAVLLRGWEERETFLYGPVLGLLAMGVLEGFHAAAYPGVDPGFLLGMTILLGGAGFALVWVPEVGTALSGKWWVPVLTAAGALVLGTTGWFAEEFLPPPGPVVSSLWTAAVWLGGAGLAAAAVRLMIEFQRAGRGELILLAGFAWTQAAGVPVELFADPWRSVWWSWQGIHLVVSAVMLGFVVRIYFQIARHLRIVLAERKWARERIRHQVYYDPLTGAGNRILFRQRLDEQVSRAHVRGGRFAMLFFDLDRFKRINDTLGSSVGDQLLKGVAQRLSEALEGEYLLARVGDDEFALLTPQVRTDKEAQSWAQTVLKRLQPPFFFGGHELHIGASIGIVFYPDDGEDAESLLKNAAIAMYRAREQGGSAFQRFRMEMDLRASERISLENRLRHALELGEFQIHYQPQVELETGRIVGAEALVRWNHSERGPVTPGEFIPLAEETGLILSIGEWVLRNACSQARKWMDGGFPSMVMAVNLSARQFLQKDLLKRIAHILRETGLPPSRLELEITESTALRDREYALAVFRDLKRMGIRLAMDDFGTGYSSLGYLKMFPIDTLKIDRSFIRDLPSDTHDTEITTAMILLGQSLDLTLLAEGVETAEQASFLREKNCHLAQGYYYSRPVPAAEFETLLRKGVPLLP